MNIWTTLGINPTNEKSEIKKAYRAKLKVTHPEDSPQEFMQLREAYEAALEYAENNTQPVDYDFPEDEFSLEDFADYEDYSNGGELVYNEDDKPKTREIHIKHDPKKAKERRIDNAVSEWWNRVALVLHDFEKRDDLNVWKDLLYNDIPYQINCYEKCRKQMAECMFDGTDDLKIYLREDVRRLVDSFFSFSPDQLAIKDWNERFFYNRMRQSEYIEFDLLKPGKGVSVDDFFDLCNQYGFRRFCYVTGLNMKDGFAEKEYDIEVSQHNEDEFAQRVLSLSKLLKRQKATYLPFEFSMLLDELEKNGEVTESMQKQLDKLTEQFGECRYIQLFNAAVMLEKGEIENSRSLLRELYLTTPLNKVFYLIYLSVLSQKAGMLFQAYMLTKQISYLTDVHTMVEQRAEYLSNLIVEEYTQKLSENKPVSDMEKVELCRMYLRSNREKDAEKILSSVSESGRNTWEYYVADCLVQFNKSVVEENIPSYTALENFDKSQIGTVDLLEWEEIKVRYVFEQKRYEECIAMCNKWLDIYPQSLAMLTIREYADYLLNDLYKNYCGLGFLLYRYPQRAEIRLLLATYRRRLGYLTDAEMVLLVVSDKYYVQHKFYEILSDGERNSSDVRKKKWLSLLEEIKNNDFNIPEVSKYGLTDLDSIYSEMSKALYVEYGFKLFEDLRKSLEEAIYTLDECDSVRKTRALFYYNSHQANKTIDAVLKGIEKCTNKSDLIWYYNLLLPKYIENGDLEKAEEIADKLCEIDENACEKIIEAYGDEISQYDEKLFEKLDKLAEVYSEKWQVIRDSCNTTSLYMQFGLITGEKKWFMKGARLAEKSLKIFGKVGGEGYLNAYVDMALFYSRVGEEKKARAAINKAFRNARTPDNLNNMLEWIGQVYEYLEDFDMAKECYQKARERGLYTCVKELRMYLKLGDYKKARTFFDEEDKIGGEMIHTYYMENGCYDEEMLSLTIDTLEKLIDRQQKEGCKDDTIGENYLCLSDLYYSKGDKKMSEKYLQKSDEYNWNSVSGKHAYTIRRNVWILWYDKKYREALELLNNNPNVDVVRNVEIDMFRYQLGKMDL